MNKHFNESGGSDALVCWINTHIMMHTFTTPSYVQNKQGVVQWPHAAWKEQLQVHSQIQ